MAKNKIQITKAQLAAPVASVQFVRTPLFNATWAEHKQNYPQIKEVMAKFIAHKLANPMAPFGGKDRPFKEGSIKGYLHVGLTFDLNLVYTISGANPRVITLLAVATHDELGTGTPANNKRQQIWSQKFVNQQGQGQIAQSQAGRPPIIEQKETS